MRVDPVLCAGLAAVLGSVAVGAPLPSALSAIALAVCLRKRLSRRAFGGVAIVLAASIARAAVAIPAFEARLEAVRDALGGPRRCAGVATVETSPVRRADALSYLARFESLDCEGRRVGEVLARLHGGPEALSRGDRVEIVAQLAVVELFRNADLPDPTPRAAKSGALLSGGALAVTVVRRSILPLAWIDRARARARRRIDATFPADAAPLARALVLGESDLPDADDAAFRLSGLSHLLAVSGTHLVFAVLGIVRAVGFLLARVEAFATRKDVHRTAAALGAVLAPAYADFAGGSGSAWRAAIMLAIGLTARAAGRAPCASRSFALSLLVGALWDPLIGHDVSFLLSAAATAGLLGFGGALRERLAPKEAGPLREALVSSTAATVSAMLPCIPLLASLGPSLTLAGVAANVIAAPFGEVVALPLCLVHSVAFFAPVERGIGLVAGGALLVVRWLARASAATTWLAVSIPAPGAWHFAVLGVGGASALLVGAKPWHAPGPAADEPRAVLRATACMATLVAMCGIEWATFAAGHPRGVLRVTVLDVGQGDSALVDLPDGRAMLVDGGGFVGSPVDPGKSVLLPLLRARRRSSVDVVVLSHPHPDHFLGLVSAVPAIGVGEFWDTGQGREQGAGPEYAELVLGLSRRGVPIRGPSELCGPERALGGARVEVLAPCPSWDSALGANDNSFVVRVRYQGHGVMLMGDAEAEAEERLLARGVGLSADLLKVGHHGSRTSSSAALVRAVAPAVATLSTGVRNRFGHPHPTTLATLARLGVPALRTDRQGSVEWRSDAARSRVAVFGGAFGERWWPGR